MAVSSANAEAIAALTSHRRFKDPIHDYISISSRVCQFIDTEHFQRLKNIKQLGTSYYVWPGASHNRFEHCLGVAHLAGRMAEHLQKSQPSLGITDRDVECVVLAGLCHDLGHGPWSHVWDGLFIPRARPGTTWKHEDASEMMFDDLILENELDVPQEDVEFIKALIAGDPSKCSSTEKHFLFDIVANKRNGIDIDKLDYIARDNYHIGAKDNLSFLRLINSARVIGDEVCYDIKDASMVYELCHTRFILHKTIYSHKAARAIEYMIVDALLEAEPYLHIADRIHSPQDMLYLDDSIMSEVKKSRGPELAVARAIMQRVTKRKLYKMVDRQVVEWQYLDLCKTHITPENIVAESKRLFAAPPPDASAAASAEVALAASLESSDVIVDISLLHYGMKDKNPLDSIKFYHKSNPNRARRAGPGSVLSLLPAVFAEIEMRVYTRLLDKHAVGVIQAGYRALRTRIPGYNPDDQYDSESTDEDDGDGDYGDGADNDRAPSPTATLPVSDAPSTSRHTSRGSLGAPTTPRAAPGTLPQSANTSPRALTKDGSMGKATPFHVNDFVTVVTAARTPSPARELRRVRSGNKLPIGPPLSGVKRGRPEEEDPSGAARKKRLSSTP